MSKEQRIRRRIGLLVPSTNTTAEPDFHLAVPDGVTVHSHRLWLDGSFERAMDRMNSELEVGARYLSTGEVEIVCMAGTTNSFYRGSDGSREMERVMSAGSGGLPAVSSSPSVVAALNYFQARRITVATPYLDWNNGRLADYLEAAGFEVLTVRGDPRAADGDPRRMNDQSPEEIADFAESICETRTEAIFCSCSGWRALEAAATIEARTSLPCVSTNMATLWRTLRTIGIDHARPGFGRLLSEMPPVELAAAPGLAAG